MGKEELQELFCIKIGLENERFQCRMLKQKPEVIFARAYQIDTMISIYELLLEMSHEIGGETLKKLIIFPNLLAFLYGGWLNLGEAETAENERFRVSWKSVCSNRLDEKRLKEEQPEIYDKYKKSVSSRRFTVKAA